MPTSNMMPVISSNIVAIGYDEPTRVLDVQFKNGDTYSYDDVPLEVWSGFQSAVSVGKYFFNNVKGRYRFFKS
jgi:hypothetical protein